MTVKYIAFLDIYKGNVTLFWWCVCFIITGLVVSEAAKLCSFLHFRDPKILPEKSLLQKANMDKSIDFMDSLEEDIPKGL